MPQYLIHYDQGNSPGPFNIYLSGSSGLNLYASNVSRTTLEGGFVITFDDGIPSSSVVIDNTGYSCDTDLQLVFPSPTPTITPSISITPTITKTPTITPTQTPTVTPTLTATPTVTPSRTVTPTITPSITPTRSVGASLTPSPTVTVTRTPTITPTTSGTFLYYYIGKYPAGSALSCGATGPIANVYLNATDYATYSSNGGILGPGMLLYNNSNGDAWSGGSQIYDPVNPTIYNVVGSVLYTSVLC